MAGENELASVEGQLIGMPLAGPESFSIQQLAYLKRALGLDETLLWSDTSWLGTDATAGSNSGTLSEAITNFEKIRVHYARTTFSSSSLPSQMVAEYDCSVISGQGGLCLICAAFLPSDRNSLRMADTLLTFSGTTFTETTGGQCNLTAASGSYDNSKIYMHPYKIVGIHRIAGGN